MIDTDLYLRADTEADLAAALPFAHQNDEWITSTHDYALDLIGPVVATDGTYDENGKELTAPIIDARFHANLRCTAEFAALVPEGIQISPDSPSRVWA
ncbi:hypothetical protein [Mesorhizobium sp. A623]